MMLCDLIHLHTSEDGKVIMLGKSRRHISSLHNLFTLYSFLCIQRDWYIMLIAFMYLDTQHFITKIQLSFGVKLVLIMNISSSFTSRWFQLLFPVSHLSRMTPINVRNYLETVKKQYGRDFVSVLNMLLEWDFNLREGDKRWWGRVRRWER